MKRLPLRFLSLLLAALFMAACSATPPPMPVDTSSVAPGQSVTRGGTMVLALQGEPLRVGQPLPDVQLVNTHMQPVELATLRGKVLLLSVVPSLDTKVCERQTHLLGDAELPANVKRITISRDLPFAQQRFADETGYKDILFLSDYRTGAFGQATGLLVDQLQLLARAIILVDQQGVVRYIQVVPEISHLPDTERAFSLARELAKGQ